MSARYCGLFLCNLFFSTAWAAIPTATDDTGTAAPGQWEISVYATGEGRDAGESYQFPAVEVETGLLDNLAIFVAGARQVDDKKGESSSSGWGNADIGLKWRPFKKDGVSLAIAPTYSQSIKSSSERRGLIEDVNVFSLPVIVGYENGDWEFYGSVGYDMTSTSVDGISYGTWVGYNIDGWKLIAEIYGEELSGSDEGATNARLGFEYVGFGPGALLFSLGTGLQDDFESDDDELNWEAFLGYRWAYE